MKFGPFEFNFKFKTPNVSGRELGESGTTIFDGSITGEEYVSELTGSTALITYDKMRKSDGVVKAALLACELPIRAARWHVEPASDDESDKEVAEFVSQCLFENMSITWDDFLRQALLMLPFGFSVFEKVFQPVLFEKKEMIGWRKFAPRIQRSIFKWETENHKDGITQLLPSGDSISIPIEKLIVFTHRKEGSNWLGISTLRNAYRSWFFKSHIEKINAMGFEKHGLGIPVGRLPKGFSDVDRDKMEELLKNIRANEQGYMILPDGWEVEFADMKAGSLKDPTATVRRYNREILGSVLAQFLDLGSGQTGSRALSVDHSAIFHNNLTAIARQVKDIVNKYAIKQLVDLNYTVAAYPKLTFSKIGVVQYDKISKALTGLVQQGIIKPDEKLEDTMRVLMDLPEKPEDQEEDEKTEPEPKKDDIEDEKKGSEYVGFRALTLAEKKVNFVDIQKKMTAVEDRLRAGLKRILSKASNDLIAQIQRALEKVKAAETKKLLKEVEVRYQEEYRKEIDRATREVFEYGKVAAANEMKKSPPVTLPETIKSMSKHSGLLTKLMVDDLIKAGLLAYSLGLQQGLSYTKTLSNVRKAIRREVKANSFNVPAIAVGSALNQGRRATFDVYQNDIYALQRSEILDAVTCNYCISVDKRVIKKNDTFTHNDIFHSSCRGLWVEILLDERDKPDIGGIPKTLRDNYETINVFRPPKNPIVRQDSPAAEYLKKKQSAEPNKLNIKTEDLIEIQHIVKELLE